MTVHWQTINLRFSAFLASDAANITRQLWDSAFSGKEPDQEQRVGRSYLVGGAIENFPGFLSINQQPGRIDVLVIPAAGARAQKQPIPNIGELSAAVTTFLPIVRSLIGGMPSLKRFALGAVMAHAPESHETLLATMQTLLPRVRFDETSLDLVYAVNRRREVHGYESIAYFNRLAKWSMFDGLIEIGGIAPNEAPVRQELIIDASWLLELDLSTPSDRNEALVQADLVRSLDEMAGLAVELALRGDIE